VRAGAAVTEPRRHNKMMRGLGSMSVQRSIPDCRLMTIAFSGVGDARAHGGPFWLRFVAALCADRRRAGVQ
jgi:hypothetical protein